jgi:uncharacterized membrane protein YdjX (TVP38/TMEM64 family)
MPDAPPRPDRPAARAPVTAPAWRRLWPLGLLALVLALAYATGLHRLLRFEALAEHRALLLGWVAAQPVLTALGFALAYAGVVAFSLPGGAVMSMAAGFLFGPLLGTLVAVPAATAGACLLFLGARHALGQSLLARGGESLARIQAALERDGFWYLLSLRLLPVVPFWLANLAPALAGMRFGPYALATLLGIIPGTAVYVGIGAGLGEVFDAGGTPDAAVILSPGILLPMLGLAALSLIGAWARRRGRAA